MLAIFSTVLFAAAALLAAGTIVATVRRHGAQALAVLTASRAVADLREFRVVLTSPATGPAEPAWSQLRRQPRRAGFRPVAVRQGEVRRAAA